MGHRLREDSVHIYDVADRLSEGSVKKAVQIYKSNDFSFGLDQIWNKDKRNLLCVSVAGRALPDCVWDPCVCVRVAGRVVPDCVWDPCEREFRKA